VDRVDALFEGRIDVLAFVGDEVWIVDYKTDRVTAKEAPRRARSYAEQGAVYRRAAVAVGHRKVRVYFAFVDPGVVVEMK
jgi:ATP-dependent exoDNAse (exonuclease V) beta subunit